MRVNIFWVIALIVLPSVSYAQVDTLMLVEIGTVQASSEITELYVEDLDGDSLKEIILCTNYFVYIYDSQTYQVDWTSPPLISPTDLLFEDINGDGLIDLSVKDSTNIYLFDPHTPQTIWTSPPLDSTYSCYTIGDRNDDDMFDVVIVSKEWFTRLGDENNRDTVWVDTYDGPSFNYAGNIILLMRNAYWEDNPYDYEIHEYPELILSNSLSGQNGIEGRLIIFSLISILEQGILHTRYSGNVYLIDGLNNNIINIDSVGNHWFGHYVSINNSKYYCTLQYILESWGSTYWNNQIYRNIYSSDSLVQSNVIWSYYGSTTEYFWRHYIVEEIDVNSSGKEISYIVNDSLFLKSYPGFTEIWTISLPEGSSIMNYTRSINIDASPLIMVKFGFQQDNAYFCYSDDGVLRAILPQQGFGIRNISDLDNDNDYEFLSLQNFDNLYIYILDYATGIGDNARLPQRAFLRTNYPNPFNSSTTIEYGLPDAGHVNIEIYDLLGRRVETLINEEKQAGRHQVVWEADRYASGLYFYRIEAGDYTDTKRMIYLK